MRFRIPLAVQHIQACCVLRAGRLSCPSSPSCFFHFHFSNINLFEKNKVALGPHYTPLHFNSRQGEELMYFPIMKREEGKKWHEKREIFPERMKDRVAFSFLTLGTAGIMWKSAGSTYRNPTSHAQHLAAIKLLV